MHSFTFNHQACKEAVHIWHKSSHRSKCAFFNGGPFLLWMDLLKIRSWHEIPGTHSEVQERCWGFSGPAPGMFLEKGSST